MAVSAIIDSLGAKSALLKHEMFMFVVTCRLLMCPIQLLNKAASAALSNILRDANEHPMMTTVYVALLEEFARDPEPIVSQSCEVALSMLEYERLGKSFEYLFVQAPVMQV
ncbi:hypothetical protein Pint_01755 [Pistacia integerrima]|uniref:Uncharacterized protein n=1 Tax=Pistacia integerrima TaxID=434235 RepID=A0ACC0ZMV2_9ROSI|nr:hypothetical protein Pint_01755 [Pistacia integerrima]